jgi:hypothetical protein
MQCLGHYSPANARDTTVCTATGWHPRPDGFKCEVCGKPKINNGTWECKKVNGTSGIRVFDP